MRVIFLLVLAVTVTLVLNSAAQAQAAKEVPAQTILATAKFTGACGILDSLILFQQTTKMPGGDEFVARFWQTEAARLGTSVQEMSEQCNRAARVYDTLWKSTKSKP